MTLAWTGAPTLADVLGPLAIVGACVARGLDNNLTRRVSLADPLQIVELKGLFAGPFNLVLGLAAGAELPGLTPALFAGAVGFLGYGISLALFVVALRHLGAPRTGAYFSTAPFLGSAAAVVALGNPVTHQLVAAGMLMAVGVWLHLAEHHVHEHVHEAMATPIVMCTTNTTATRMVRMTRRASRIPTFMSTRRCGIPIRTCRTCTIHIGTTNGAG
jgi:drug/metabolite transporter (DMT)-like permease